MNARSSIDLCLLCQTNTANKKNSHILPKFLANGFLGTKGKPQKGFSISISINSDKNRIKTIQDSPKEDFILCEDCEAYFSLLEGIVSDTFINWKLNASEEMLKSVPISLNLGISDEILKKTLHVFNYSIFWRASISSCNLFQHFKIEKKFENELRETLNNYRASKKAEYLQLLNSNSSFKIFPISILTSKSFKDETKNLLYVDKATNPYCLLIDKYIFKLFQNISNFNDSEEKYCSNIDLNEFKTIVLSEEQWEQYVQKFSVQTAVNTWQLFDFSRTTIEY